MAKHMAEVWDEDLAKQFLEQTSEAIEKFAVSCSAPIILDSPVDSGIPISGGSCVFVKSPTRTFAITAAHVLHACIEHLIIPSSRVLVG